MADIIEDIQSQLESAVAKGSPTVTVNLMSAWCLLAVARHLPRDAFWLAGKLREDAETMFAHGHPIKSARISRAANAIERIGISAKH